MKEHVRVLSLDVAQSTSKRLLTTSSVLPKASRAVPSPDPLGSELGDDETRPHRANLSLNFGVIEFLGIARIIRMDGKLFQLGTDWRLEAYIP